MESGLTRPEGTPGQAPPREWRTRRPTAHPSRLYGILRPTPRWVSSWGRALIAASSHPTPKRSGCRLMGTSWNSRSGVAPSLPPPLPPPPHSEAQWVSVDGNLVELAVWCGSLARPGVRRAALVIRGNSHHELTGESDAADVPVGPLGEYLYEPDGAVIRARQIGALARTHAATMISDGIA